MIDTTKINTIAVTATWSAADPADKVVTLVDPNAPIPVGDQPTQPISGQTLRSERVVAVLDLPPNANITSALSDPAISSAATTIRQWADLHRVTEHFEDVEFVQEPSGHPAEEDVVAAARVLKRSASEVRAKCVRLPYPDEHKASRLLPLCQMLEIIRARANAPIRIVSGYRSHEYNEVLRQKGLRLRGKSGVAEHSEHLEGRAADIRAQGLSAEVLYRLILILHSAGQLPRLGGIGLYREWVHVDIRPRSPGEKLAMWGLTPGTSA